MNLNTKYWLRKAAHWQSFARVRTLYVQEEIQTDLPQKFVNLLGEGPWDEQEDTLPPEMLQVG